MSLPRLKSSSVGGPAGAVRHLDEQLHRIHLDRSGHGRRNKKDYEELHRSPAAQAPELRIHGSCRSHDRHRGLRTRYNATASADSSDRVTIPQVCSSPLLPLDRPRHGALRYHAVASNRATIYRARPHPPLIHQPLHRRTTCWINSIPINQLTRGTQIPIAPAARTTFP